MLCIYAASLRWVLRHRLAMSLTYAVILAATVYLYVKIPKGFIPEQDNDQMFVNTEAAQGTSFERMAVLQQRVNQRHMLAAGSGRIVNVASVGGLVGMADGAPYTTSKHAVIGFT